MAFETCTVHGAWFSMCDCGVAQNCRIKLLMPCYMRTFSYYLWEKRGESFNHCVLQIKDCKTRVSIFIFSFYNSLKVSEYRNHHLDRAPPFKSVLLRYCYHFRFSIQVLNNYLIFKIHFGRVKIIIYGVFGNEYIGSSFGRFCGL
jgi:hypothetical protein